MSGPCHLRNLGRACRSYTRGPMPLQMTLRLLLLLAPSRTPVGLGRLGCSRGVLLRLLLILLVRGTPRRTLLLHVGTVGWLRRQ